MKNRRYAVASVIAAAAFAALFMVLPSKGAGREIKIVGLQYRPAAFTIAAGDAVTFENDTTLTHTATCRGCRQDSGDIQPRTFKTLTFPKAGRYLIFCRYHGAAGMAATLTVR
jgi:plastocyanin